MKSLSAWVKSFKLRPLEIVSVHEEESGGTAKALLRTEDGLLLECVRIPMYAAGNGGTRFTLCISSQAGCRMNCLFCETGRSGFTRNLSAEEIACQVSTVCIALGWEIRNIVFMGMGEPLDNLAGLTGALRILLDQSGPGFGQERITVCTCGLDGGFEMLKGLGYKRLNVSLSLNAGTDAVRTSIMPVNKTTGLSALATAMASYPMRKNFAFGLNYCLLPGINDTEKEADGVAIFAKRVGRSVLNLIPYNQGTEPIAPTPEENEITRFESMLTSRGVFVKLRAAKGRSIMAACGQLAGKAVLPGKPL